MIFLAPDDRAKCLKALAIMKGSLYLSLDTNLYSLTPPLRHIAVMCDIEQMFYQFRVVPEHCNYLRFLWWDSDDYTKKPVEYHMTVHLFGATSSRGCANFGLKRIVADNEAEFGKDVADFLRYDFYVDDGLKSLSNTEKTLGLINNSIAMCRKGGVRLCKFVSNERYGDSFIIANAFRNKSNSVGVLHPKRDTW